MAMEEKKRFGLSGSALKWIALITMLIDHAGVILIEHHYPAVANMSFGDPMSQLYVICRMIGRFAFPIFAFLLAEGAFRTKNIKAYAVRLGLFAVISEIPFDYGFYGRIYWGYQNIFFTLLIGLMMLGLIHNTKSWLLRILYFLLACGTAHLLKSDYGAFGIAVIMMMDLFRQYKKQFVLPTAVLLLNQLIAPLAMIPLYFYNGERGKQPKWLMYTFYPLHILALTGISKWLL